MHTTLQPQSNLAATFLQRLRSEEQLLTDALAKANEVFTALRGGDLPAAQVTTVQQYTIATALQNAGAARAAATGALAHELGISADGLTLSVLAARLPEPLGTEVRALRDRLLVLTRDFTAIHARNANLINHLRSFFRGVLADLTADDAPARYGPSGNWLSPHLAQHS